MGFFKKLFKGVKKVFKKIGRGIKKVAGKIGKFMGKIGIVGQIALSFLLPGIGAMLGKAAMGMMGSTNALISGAGKFLNVAVKIGQKAGSLVKSVGEGVTKVIGKTIGATLNAVPGGKSFTGFLKNVTNGKLDFVGDTFLGKDGSLLGDGGILGTAKDSVINIGSKTTDLFSKSTVDSSLNKFAVDANSLSDIRENFKDTPQVSTDEFTANLQEGQGAIEALNPDELIPGQARPLSVDDLFEPVGPKVNKVNSFGFDEKGFSTTDSLLAPSNRILTPEELAAGSSFEVGKDNLLTIKDPKPSLGSRILNSNPVTRARAKTASKFTTSNVLSAVDQTFGVGGQQATGEAGYAFDIPDADQQDVGAGGAKELVSRIDTNIRVQGYEALYQRGPQSSWGKTFSGLAPDQQVT